MFMLEKCWVSKRIYLRIEFRWVIYAIQCNRLYAIASLLSPLFSSLSCTFSMSLLVLTTRQSTLGKLTMTYVVSACLNTACVCRETPGVCETACYASYYISWFIGLLFDHSSDIYLFLIEPLFSLVSSLFVIFLCTFWDYQRNEWDWICAACVRRNDFMYLFLYIFQYVCVTIGSSDLLLFSVQVIIY